MSRMSVELEAWRQERWWLSEESTVHYPQGITREQVDEFVAAVLLVFNKRWAESDPRHPALVELFSRGSVPLEALIGMGRNLIAMRGVKGLRHLIGDLRRPDTYESASLELSLAALLRMSGFEIELRPATTNSKRADLATRMGKEEVFFEVKILRESDESIALDFFTLELHRRMESLARVAFANDHTTNWFVNLQPRFARWFGRRMVEEPQFFQDLLALIESRALKYLKSGAVNFTIARVGEFRFGPPELVPNSTIAGGNVSTEFELKRILRPRLRNAIQQLHPDIPGIVLFRTKGFLKEEESCQAIREFLLREGTQAAHVTAVICLPMYYVLPNRWSPFRGFAVENPCARVPSPSVSALRTLVDQCGIYEFGLNSECMKKQ